jgi:hypothetical protein
VGYRDARGSSHADVKPHDAIVGRTVSHTIARSGETGTIARRTITVAEGDVTRQYTKRTDVEVRRRKIQPASELWWTNGYIVWTTVMLHGGSLMVKVFCQLDSFDDPGPFHTLFFDAS